MGQTDNGSIKGAVINKSLEGERNNPLMVQQSSFLFLFRFYFTQSISMPFHNKSTDYVVQN